MLMLKAGGFFRADAGKVLRLPCGRRRFAGREKKNRYAAHTGRKRNPANAVPAKFA